jgi:hypothetical protein
MKLPGPLAALLGGGAPAPVIQSTPGRTWEGIPRMPATFGRQGGPRQRPDRNQGYPTNVGSTLATWIAVEADEAHLAALLPPGFAIAEPLLIVEAVTLSGLPWLAGRGYEMLLLSTPVTYAAGDIEHRGRLELVTWEDCPDAILSGREELGWNKVYADTMTRHTGQDGKTGRYLAAWGGTTFFELEITLNRTPALPAGWREGPLMHYRVLPRTGEWGHAEIDQVTANSASPPITAMRSLVSGSGSFRFIPAGFERLPTLSHIVERLAAISLGQVVDAGEARTASWTDVADIRILSSAAPAPFNHPTDDSDDA